MSTTPHPTKNRGLATPRFWQIIYYPQGKKGGKVTLVFEGTKAEAVAHEMEIRKSVIKPVISVNAQMERCLPDFFEWYNLDRAALTIEAAHRHLNRICQHMGKLPLTAITNLTIEAYKRARLADGLKPASINNELFHLNVFFTWAAKNHLVASATKCELFPGKLTRSPLPVMPTRAAFKAIIAKVRPEVKGLAMLEFYAGLRRSEALNLAAECVFLDRGLIVVLGKGNKQRIVPIQDKDLIDELEKKLKEVKTGPLWINPQTGRPYVNVRDSLRSAAKAAGVDLRVYPHLLRHGFGTGAAEAGVTPQALQSMMGHSDLSTTAIYTHLAATHLIEEMKKMQRPDTVSKN
ncbi:conserved hypothetical protein [Gammaproteobacteria bacterium]